MSARTFIMRSRILRPFPVVIPRIPLATAQIRRFTPAASVSGYGDPGQVGADKEIEKSHNPLEPNHENNTEHPGREPVPEAHAHQGGTSTSGGGGGGSSSGKPQPRIWNQKDPINSDDPEVKRHNEEFEKRHGKKQDDEKVEKDFWNGKFLERGRGCWGTLTNLEDHS